MNGIERLNLIERIASELQATMTYTDINTYLTGLGVDCSVSTSNVNSKRIYSKEILSEVDNSILFILAKELKVKHNYYEESQSIIIEPPTFWREGFFRLFLSHLSKFKTNTALLQQALLRYGISSFVAHNDIEPTREWQNEIIKALFTMDALVAILIPGFKESNWTDQEIGVAVGRDVLIIPIRKGLDPYGFIGKYQGLQGYGKTVKQVAKEIYEIILAKPKTRNKLISALVNNFLLTSNEKEALEKLILINNIENIPEEFLKQIQENSLNNNSISSSKKVVKIINQLLMKYDLQSLKKINDPVRIDEDVPF